MAKGILSKGITISHSATADGTYVVLHDLQSIPDLGGSVDKVEVTTLSDGNKRYINGIKDFGDLAFEFLYDNSTETSSYRVLRTIEKAETVEFFKIELPDETTFEFSGQVSTNINSAGVGDALTFNATITLNSEMEVTNPA